MTDSTPNPRGYVTQPLLAGAPLPEDMVLRLSLPSTDEIQAELERAEIELMYAVARHRKAWHSARHHKTEAESRSVWAEGYAPYQKAIGDVRWWREEMNAQADVVQALSRMRTTRQPTRRQPRERRQPSIREILIGWSDEGGLLGRDAPITQPVSSAAQYVLDLNKKRPMDPYLVRLATEVVSKSGIAPTA